ncbi:MAG TPA: L,D-transpeptidase, partial [Pyrinomonadaceae bacterium]|nr:L,D-transpeptidase [Pyrinomonadaceae bacterium]
MKRLLVVLCLAVLALMATNCATNVNNSNSTITQIAPSPSPSLSPSPTATPAQLTLPVLEALLANESFVNDIKAKLQLTDDQVASLKKVATAAVLRLRETNAEEGDGDAAAARARAAAEITPILGEEKTTQLDALAASAWANGGEEAEARRQAELAMAAKPNAVPTDTRVVVNIPAFRMDLFRDGTLVKSYKVGIGYPEFPLPQGMRKAQTIIFNPTWTPPDSPWVAKMKDVAAGEMVEAGSKLNPLGPIKIPIGLPSLIHGGKSPAKIGHFASHGCVGLTNAQVKDFTMLLAQAAETDISDRTMANYLKDKTKTRSVKLKQTVPVELRYETIVVQNGKLHIYRDVYNENANTEQKLRDVLDAQGIKLEDLPAAERDQVLSALNSMSAHPKKMPAPSPAVNSNTAT